MVDRASSSRALTRCTAAAGGRRSRAGEPFRALLLQVFYTVRSERLLMEQLLPVPLVRGAEHR
jgi:hypothetical protein